MAETKALPRMDRKSERLLRHFLRKPNVRAETIQALVSGERVEDATPQEQVAVITLWCAREPIDVVIQRVTSHALEGSTGRLEAQFFPVLEESVGGLERAGLDRSAADLLRVGEVLAEFHLQTETLERFREVRQSKTRGRVRDLPFLKQRGR